MKTKSYRYNHEKICQGKLTDRPVKPRAKAKPKPETIHETIDEEIIETPPAPKQPNEVMSPQRIQQQQHEVISQQRIPNPVQTNIL